MQNLNQTHLEEKQGCVRKRLQNENSIYGSYGPRPEERRDVSVKTLQKSVHFVD